MLMIVSKQTFNKFAISNNLKNNLILGLFDISYSNNRIIFQWLDWIKENNVKKQLKIFEVLIIDRYGLNLTDKCW